MYKGKTNFITIICNNNIYIIVLLFRIEQQAVPNERRTFNIHITISRVGQNRSPGVTPPHFTRASTWSSEECPGTGWCDDYEARRAPAEPLLQSR